MTEYERMRAEKERIIAEDRAKIVAPWRTALQDLVNDCSDDEAEWPALERAKALLKD